MPKNRFFALANGREDQAGSVKKAIQKLLGFLNAGSPLRATIVVPSLEYIDATVVPEVCKELGLDDFVKTRSVVLGNCTLYLCAENMLDRGHRNNQIYLVLFPMPAFISKVDQLHTWSTLIVVASEDDASDWRSQNVVEDL